jgi:hypothetical protein
MQSIVVLLPTEFQGQIFEKQEVWKKIGVTYSPVGIGDVLCEFYWGEAMVPREQLLFIGPSIMEIREDQLSDSTIFQNFVKANQGLILETLLDLLGGILVRNSDNLRRMAYR